MTTQLAPLARQQFFDNNGVPLAGGLLYTYVAGTTTPQATYTDSTGSKSNPNPIVLDARGSCALWLTLSSPYKFNLTDSNGNQIPGWPVDNINGSSSGPVLIPSGDMTGVTDPSVINAAITSQSAVGGGTVTLYGGAWYAASSITLASNVTLIGYGATLNYSGSGNAVTCPTSGVVQGGGIFGLTINGGTTAAVLLNLISTQRCWFRDIHLLSSSLTNTAIAMTCNATGTPGFDGTLNNVDNGFENIFQDTTAGGNGCGNFLTLLGNSSSQGLVTDNSFFNIQAQLVNICGINFIQWCDSNVFTGMTRIALNGNVSTANGIGVNFASASGQGGVYSETIMHLAIDTFAIPTTDNRQGIVCSNLLSTKNIHVWILEMGPEREAYAITGIAAGSILSGVINVSPRSNSNYQNINMLGTNLSVGNANSNPSNTTVYSGVGAWLSASSQFGFYQQASAYNSGAPSLGCSFGTQPGAAASGSPYTVAQIMGYYCGSGAVGANATVTASYGFYCADQSYASSSNYGFYSALSSGAGKYNFYASGTAANFFQGTTAIGGTATNDSASAGFVGEFVQSVIGSGSAVGLTNATPANVTSISLTAGDWDVWGNIAFSPAGTTTVTFLAGSINTTSATLGGYTTQSVAMECASFTPGSVVLTQTPPQQRISLSATTTVYLVAQANFGTSTMSAYGSLTARRRR